MTENCFGINKWQFCNLFTGAALVGYMVHVQALMGYETWILTNLAPPLPPSNCTSFESNTAGGWGGPRLGRLPPVPSSSPGLSSPIESPQPQVGIFPALRAKEMLQQFK